MTFDFIGKERIKEKKLLENPQRKRKENFFLYYVSYYFFLEEEEEKGIAGVRESSENNFLALVRGYMN
jgi:hypothetical protein